MTIKEDDIVLCTVKKIEKTIVFVNIEGNGQGSIIISEIAAGRIRNIRDYVTPNKKIVCKVLNIVSGHPQLSLRRVTTKEKEEVLDKAKKEKNLLAMLKTLSKTPEKILEQIKESYNAAEFIEEARENPKLIEDFLPKADAEKLKKILEEKKEKDKEIKQVLTLKSTSAQGLSDIKSILEKNQEGVEINYLGSSKFEITIKAKDFKTANQTMEKVLSEIKEKAKNIKADLVIKEK